MKRTEMHGLHADVPEQRVNVGVVPDAGADGGYAELNEVSGHFPEHWLGDLTGYAAVHSKERQWAGLTAENKIPRRGVDAKPDDNLAQRRSDGQIVLGWAEFDQNGQAGRLGLDRLDNLDAQCGIA